MAVVGTNAYVSGITDSPLISGASNSLLGTEDGFVAKFDSTGHQVYFTYVGGSAGSPATPLDADAIAIDSTGVAYITGKTTASDLPSPQNSLHGVQDAFVTKINTDGTIASQPTWEARLQGLVAAMRTRVWGSL